MFKLNWSLSPISTFEIALFRIFYNHRVGIFLELYTHRNMMSDIYAIHKHARSEAAHASEGHVATVYGDVEPWTRGVVGSQGRRDGRGVGLLLPPLPPPPPLPPTRMPMARCGRKRIFLRRGAAENRTGIPRMPSRVVTLLLPLPA
jgi:hypothetical protein